MELELNNRIREFYAEAVRSGKVESWAQFARLSGETADRMLQWRHNRQEIRYTDFVAIAKRLGFDTRIILTPL